MLIGIIAANNIRYSPYIFFYTRILDDIGISYELIYPNRSNLVDEFSSETHILSWNNKKNTAVAYFEYTREVKQVVAKKRYDFLIVLTSNNAVFLARWLKKKYSRRYILDIRDYTHENILIYYILEKMAVNNSLLNIISSKRFKEFLPPGDYLTCHNISKVDIIRPPRITRNKVITIGYIGKGNYLEQCISICKKICNDNRFRFVFYGLDSVPENMSQFANNENIEFKGVFEPKEKEAIILGCDILFNAYGNGTPLLDCALSNKLYDALVYGKPILTSPGTYMSEIAGPFAFDSNVNDESFLNDLYSWYQDLNEDKLLEFAQHQLFEILKESQYTENCIKNAITERC